MASTGVGVVNEHAGTQSAAQPLIECDDVTFAYGPEQVIQGVDLKVHKGEFVSLYGPSGCGKSTLLNMVAGLLPPSSGTIRVSGRPLTGVNTAVGYMTQHDTLLPWKSVWHNIALPLKFRKMNKAQIAERVDFYLRLLNLEHAAQRYPSQLSGGMKRRALFARSVIYEPEMILMDEPFAAVDARLREELHAETRRTVEKLGQTVLFVTHDVAEAVLLSDKVVVLGGTPSGVVDVIDIPFGTGRDLGAIGRDPRFQQVQSAIRASLDGPSTAPASE